MRVAMKVLMPVIVGLLAFLPIEATADMYSGNKLIGPCQRWASDKKVPDPIDAFDQGVCAAVVSTVYYYGSVLPAEIRFCRPEGANTGQALRIVVKYLTDNPAITDRDLRELAVEALQKAWPCRK
jgi:hypothetical protein